MLDHSVLPFVCVNALQQARSMASHRPPSSPLPPHSHWDDLARRALAELRFLPPPLCFPCPQHERRLATVEHAVESVVCTLQQLQTDAPPERAGLAWREAAVEHAVFEALKQHRRDLAAKQERASRARRMWRWCRNLAAARRNAPLQGHRPSSDALACK